MLLERQPGWHTRSPLRHVAVSLDPACAQKGKRKGSIIILHLFGSKLGPKINCLFNQESN